MRYLLGAFSASDWAKVYKNIYDNTVPGGWIEQVEMDVGIFCDDGTLPSDSILTTWGNVMSACAERADRPFDTIYKMRGRMEEAGFVNVQQQDYKAPVGTWPKMQIYKDAGRVNLKGIMAGLEGYVLFMLTKFGAPKPWSVEEVKKYVERAKVDLNNPKYHVYNKARRVWAMKPFDK